MAQIRPPDQAVTAVRAGIGYWFSSLGARLRFDVAQARQWAGMMVSVQVMLGAGMAEVYGFFYPHVTPAAALYIATGTPALALIPLGFSMIPNTVCQQKLSGTFEFIWSLPGPRSAQGASTFLLYTVLALPGMVLALIVSALRYGIHLSVSPEIVPAALLCSLMAISVGFGMAVAIPRPLITNLITNALTFVVLLFSPIVFPLSQLPGVARRHPPRAAVLQHGGRHPSRPDARDRDRPDCVLRHPGGLDGRRLGADGLGRRPTWLNHRRCRHGTGSRGASYRVRPKASLAAMDHRRRRRRAGHTRRRRVPP
jgi:ABC-2 type transport system permease protein